MKMLKPNLKWVATAFGLAMLAASSMTFAQGNGATRRRVVFPGTVPADANGLDNPIALEAKQRGKADFASRLPHADLVDQRMKDGKTYKRVEIPGLDAVGAPGMPALPYREALVRVPAESKARLVIDSVTWQAVDGEIEVAPVQPPWPDVWRFNTDRADDVVAFTKNEATYRKDAFIQTTPVVLGDRVRIRGAEYVEVIYQPVAYNPARKQMRIAHDVQWHLEISEPAQPVRRRPDTFWNRGQDAIDVRTEEQIKAEAPPAEGSESPSESDEPTTDGTAWSSEDEVLPASDSEPQPDLVASAYDADYLIITPDVFADEVAPLADWKHKKGYRTYVATLTEVGSTQADIANYIQNAYDNGIPTTYVLLIGDHENLPAYEVVGHPYHGGLHEWHVDHPYSLVDGGDVYPDLYMARLPGDTETQITTMVNAAIAYDKTPDTGNWYTNVLVAGEFQDSDDNNLIADRMFMETLNRVADFLGPDYDFFGSWNGFSGTDPFNKGFAIHTALTWGASTNEALEYEGWGYGSRLTPPQYVPDSWKAMGSGTKTEVSGTINNGVTFVMHRDHGYAGGWANPQYNDSDVANLLNGAKKPFVFSLNCETGWFDGLDKFGEAWMRNPNGGAIGYTGAARVSYSGYNDCFHVGIMDALWDDYSTYDDGRSIPYGNSWRPAEAVTRAKGFLFAAYGTGSSYALLTARLFNWFGDPELQMRTETPVQLAVTHPATIPSALSTDVGVTVTRGGSACQGALVAIVMDAGGVYATAITDAAGEATLPCAPTTKGTMSITVTEHNSIPYEGTIEATVQSIDVSRGGSIIAVGGVDGVSGFTVGAGNPLAYTISNVEGGELEITTPVTISGENNCAVTVTTQPSGTVAGGSSTSLDLSVTPATEGTWRFAVSIANNDTNKNPYVWTATGVAGLSGVPLMVVTHADTFLANGGTDFVSGTEAMLGTQRTYAIGNLGDADLTLTTPVTISGETNCSVAVDTQPTSPVAASNSTDLVLTVTPAAGGAWSASVSIANNDADKNPYAWTISGTALGRYTVTYDANGGSGDVPVDPANPYLEGNPVTVLGNTGNLVRAGFGFDGWNTAADGSGTAYAIGATFTLPDADVTLYAKWNALPVVDAGPDQQVLMGGARTWTPADMDTVAWYDADDASTMGLDGSTVTNWLDKSGNGYHGIGNNSPDYLAEDSILGGRPSIGNAATTGDSGILLPSFGAKTVYVVAYFDDGTKTAFGNNEYRALFAGDDSANNYSYRVMSNQNGPDWIGSSHFNDAGTYRNGATVSSLAALPMPATLWKFKASALRTQGRQLGYYPLNSRDWPGRYAEWIFTDGSEDLETEQKIEGYLAHKWGLAGSLPTDHPYKSAPLAYTAVDVALDGTVSDPDTDPLTTSWTVDSGPASVALGDPSAVDTLATFTAEGIYALRLTADDGVQQVYDDVVITVNSATGETYTVTYDGNGSDGGAIPADTNAYLMNSTVTVLANTGSLVSTGYTFADWNTAPDGSGTRYAPGATFNITSNTTLYAHWVGVMVDPDSPHAVLPLAAEHQSWRLVFSDEFNGIEVDTNKWMISESLTTRAPRTDRGIDAWFYKPANVELDGSNLVLNVTKPETNVMYTGSIESRNIFEPMYGYLEARVQVADTTKDTHTAFWMQGHDMLTPVVTGDAHNGAEVDIFESAWFDDYLTAVVHIDGYGADKQANTKQYDTPGLHSGFNVFGLEWTASYMKIYYNGEHKVTYEGTWVPRTNEWVWLSNGASFGDIGTFSEEEIGYLTEAKWDYVRVWESTTNLPPAFSVDPMEKPLAIVDEAYSDTIAGSAMDPELDPLTYSKVSGPAWLSVATDGTLAGTPSSADWGTNTWTVQVVDDQGGMDQATLRIIVQNPEDPRMLVGGALLNGDFNANPGESMTFAETEVWYNTRGLQTQVATLNDKTYDGSQNASMTSGRGFGVDTGYAIVEGDSFDFSYVWKDDWDWVDASDQVTVSLFVTDDNTITGARTDLAVDNSGIRQVNDAYEAVSRENVYTATASDAGKTLFAAIETDSSGFSRLDNFVLVVNPYVELPPAAPTGLSATPSVGQVDLSWTAVSDATSYKVKRASISGSGYIEIGTPTGTNYTDSVANGATYYYVVSAVNAVGESADSAEVAVTLPHVIPFADDFEARSLGDLNGQNGWVSSNAVVQTSVAIDTQAASITSATGFVEQEFWGSETNVWMDMQFQPVFSADVQTPPRSDLTTFFFFNTNGNPVVYDSTNVVTVTNTTVTTGTWVRLTVNADYGAKDWDLYVDDSLVATNLGFYDDSVTHCQLFGVKGAGDASTTLDDVSLGSGSPFGDTPVISNWPSASPITYGQAVSNATLSGGSASVPGVFSYDSPSVVPDAGDYLAPVTFTPDDATNYLSVAGSVTVSVAQASAMVTLSDLTQTYDGTARVVGAATAPTGLVVDVSYDGSVAAPTNAGSYAIVATVNETNYAGSTNGTLVVNQMTTMVDTWPTASSIEEGQAVSNSVLSGGSASTTGSFDFETPSATPPLGTNSVNVIFTPTDAVNYTSVTGSVDVVVTEAVIPATVTLSDLTQVYDGTAREVTVTTDPTNLAVSVTYDASPTAPTDVGSYAVEAIVTEPGYSGSTNGTLIVSQATPNVSVWPTASNITVGQAVSNSVLSGGSVTPTGTFSFDSPTTILPEGVYAAAVTFLPDDTINYTNVAGTADITVLPLPPSVPTNLVAAASLGQVALEWTSASGATNYTVKRSDVSGSNYVAVGSTAATNYTDTAVTNGSIYYYVVSASNAGGESANSAEVVATLQHALPFAEDFESLTLGGLDGQNLWQASNTVVQSSVAIDTQAASITSATGYVEQEFWGSETNVWMDMQFQPVFSADVQTPPRSDLTTFFFFNTNGNPVVYDGTNVVTVTNTTVTTGTWVRLTVNADYGAKDWDLYVDDSLVATNLGFYDDSVTHCQLFGVRGAGDASATLDDVSLSTDSPFGDYLSFVVFSLYGSPFPSGVNQYTNNAPVNAWIPDSPVTMGSAQYVCTGWIGSGSGLTSGTDTNFSFTIKEDTTLTWQWTTNYWVDLSTTGE